MVVILILCIVIIGYFLLTGTSEKTQAEEQALNDKELAAYKEGRAETVRWIGHASVIAVIDLIVAFITWYSLKKEYQARFGSQ